MTPYFWYERKRIVISLASLMCATALGLVYPNLLRILVDNIIMDGKFELVPKLSLFIVGVIALKSLLQYIHGFVGARVGNRLVLRLRNTCYEKLQMLPANYYDKVKTGDLVSRMTSDLEAIRNFIGFDFAQFINMGLTIVFGSLLMLWIDWRLTLLTLLLCPLLIFMTFRFEGHIHPAYRGIRQSMGRLSATVQENIAGIRTVKSFAREDHEVDKFAVHNETYRQAQVEASDVLARYYPVIELLANLCPVLLLLFGGLQVIHGSLSLGEWVQMSTLTWLIVSPMWWIGFHINKYTQAKASGERVIELLDHQTSYRRSNCTLDKPTGIPIQGDVSFEQVSFAYGDDTSAYALSEFTLQSASGSVIGIIGRTGSGKSTVMHLLTQAYEAAAGKIQIDGVEFDRWDPEILKEAIVPVFQETFLFSASIRDNISYGVDEVTDEQIMEAAVMAQAHEFIERLPKGYDTVIGERGLGLSGGQKQRIAIARALIRNPRILLLDDATSAVDVETEAKILTALKEYMKGRTTFIIAHRISSVWHADEIIVLDKGKIVQRGQHEQLAAAQGLYRDIYEVQSSGLMS
nr:ABC transporter ATP-binding protein [Paenibacillus lemnae]